MAWINFCSRTGGIFTPIITAALLTQDNGFQIAIIIYVVLLVSCGFYISLLKETRGLQISQRNVKK